MRIPYYCPYCDQRSTRRWNLDVHIKRKHGDPPGRYLASHPMYNRNIQSHQFGSATVADSVGETLQPRYIHQAPVGISQYSANSPWHVMDDQSSLSQGNTLKIHELKRLMNKYQLYHTNPNGIIKWAIYCSINGDNKPLDEKLEQLRRRDSSKLGL
jgi:hypothetical protein